MREIPPRLELVCLNALWSLGQGNVQQVRQTIERPLAYTTVMTILERLVRRNLVVRRKEGRAFVYAPQASRDKMRRLALREFVDSYFNGSEGQLITFLQTGHENGLAPENRGAALDTALL